MNTEEVTLHVRKLEVRNFKTNALLCRKEFTVVVLHPGEQTWCFEDLRTQIAEKYNVLDTRTIILKDFESKFGGGKSTGKCHMYFTVDDAIKAEPTAILQRYGLVSGDRRSVSGYIMHKNSNKKRRGAEKTSVPKTGRYTAPKFKVTNTSERYTCCP